MVDGVRAGRTNADFARLFRKEAQEESLQGGGASGADELLDFDSNPMRQAAARRQAQEEQGWDDDSPVRAGLGSGARVQAQENTKAEPTAAEVGEEMKRRVLSEKELKREYGWGKHTKGFGMKLMAKMGFTGRLGKEEKGVSSTIEVVVRPAQMGLGFGSFKEASALKQNKRVEKELKGETFDEKEEVANRKRERDALQEDDTLWRKRKAPMRSRQYKKASEVSQEAHSKKARNEVILDMRGPDVRVLDQMTDAYDDQDTGGDTTPKLGDELIYNVRMVVNLAQGRIYDLTQKIDTNKATLRSMQQEAKILQSQVDADNLRWSNVEGMMTKMESLKDLASKAVENLALDDVLVGIRDIRERYPLEFEGYKMHQIVPSLVIPPLEALISSTNMLEHSSTLNVVEQFQQLQLSLLELPDSNDRSEVEVGVFHHIKEKRSSLGDDIYNHVLEEVLWPSVVHMVNTRWVVKSDQGGCLLWFQTFQPHLSRDFTDAFLHRLVLPRLKKECQRWDPHTDVIPIHEWLLPWEAHLGTALASVFPDIQQTLGNALNKWHPSDASVLPVISPWRDHWGEAEFAKFTHRHILRKLIRCLQREFEIDPLNQSLEVLEWVLAWQNYLPERQFVALFEGEFFPRWLRVLRKWVSGSPDLAELENWYNGWKVFFQKYNLAAHPRVVVQLQGALVLLDAACTTTENDTGESTPIPVLNPRAATSYQEALVNAIERTGTATKERSPASESTSSGTRAQSHHAVGLKDLVENLALTHDVVFKPKGLHDGQQVYIFGTHRIIIEQGVVFMEVETKGKFKPVDIDALL